MSGTFPDTPLQQHFATLGACSDGRQWVGERTAKQCWDELERPDWLLWWAAKCGVERKLLVRSTLVCAREVEHLNEDPRVKACNDTLERWLNDAATLDEVREARRGAASAASASAYAAYASAYAAYASAYAASAAYAASDYAAYAASASAYAASAASASAYAASAAYAASDYAASAASASRKKMCDLIRGVISQPWSDGQ